MDIDPEITYQPNTHMENIRRGVSLELLVEWNSRPGLGGELCIPLKPVRSVVSESCQSAMWAPAKLCSENITGENAGQLKTPALKHTLERLSTW